MIIKSMSRKERTFGQLVGYIERDHEDSPLDLYHNFFEHKRDGVVAEFETNAQHLAARKNGNVMYHEIVSITRQPDLNDDEQKAALKDLAQAYIQERAPDCLVFGTLHDDTDHSLHYHLIISANAVADTKRHSLKKAEFARFKRNMERLCNERYPQLNQGRVMETSREHPSGQLNESGVQMHRRTGHLPRLEALIARVQVVLAACDTRNAAAQLASNDLSFYTRGKHTGVVDGRTGRKHRLKTLGLQGEFERFQGDIELGELQARVAEQVRHAPPIERQEIVLAGERQNETPRDDSAGHDDETPRQPESFDEFENATPEPVPELESTELPEIPPEREPLPVPQMPIAARAQVQQPIHQPEAVQQPVPRQEPVPQQTPLRRQANSWTAELKRRSAMLADWRRRREEDYEDER